jgi:hypothetical protein
MELKRYLRVVASTGDDDDDYSMVEISNRRAREAADHIEKLEAALRSIAANACCDSCREAALVARKALEGKDD